MAFQGFSAKTVGFLADLAASNSKDWFDANRARYQDAFVDPAKGFVAAIAAPLAEACPGAQAVPKINGSIFRINRDTRFSRDKTPYKTHLDLWFWEGARQGAISGLFLRLTPASLSLGAGAHMFTPPALATYRATLARSPAPLLAALDGIAAHGFNPLGSHYKRPPRGWESVDERLDALALHNALYTERTSGHPSCLGTPGFVDHCVEAFSQAYPLHRWLVDTLGASNSARG